MISVARIVIVVSLVPTVLEVGEGRKPENIEYESRIGFYADDDAVLRTTSPL